MKRILITGGLGFLGSYALLKWYKEGWNIDVIDNLSSNVISPDDEIVKQTETNVIVKDVLDYTWDLEKKYDMILHLASPVGPVGILKHSGTMAGYIIDDAYWAIEGAKKNNCPLIFISTSEVYGHRDSAVELKEDDIKVLKGKISVRNEYSMSKLLCEIILSNTAKVSDLKYQIIRPFNISGARQLKDGGFVLPTFVQQALKNEPITVYGDGKQVRAFTHASDIINGVYLTSVVKNNEHWNETWNIGIPENTSTIQRMAELVKELSNSKSEIIHIDPKTIHGDLYEEAWDKIPESTKIQTELGWTAKWNVSEIINDVIKHYRN